MLILGALSITVAGLLLVLGPLSGSGAEIRGPRLYAAIGGLFWLGLVCGGLWRNTAWTWWLLVIPAYTLAVLGFLFALNEPDWIYRFRNGFRALIFLVAAVWYFQFKPSVVSYYAAIEASPPHLGTGSRRDAA